jgi:hypothetical protein
MNAQDFRSFQEAYMEVYQLDEVSDRKVKAVRDARKRTSMVGSVKIDRLIDQRNKRTGSKVKKTSMGQVADKYYAKKNQKEEYDIYDIILSHLLDEGYAETPEAAEAIMVNMSEEWRDIIIG